MKRKEIAAPLLGWYDAAHRRLPWRIAPGDEAAPDPYRIWLSEIMLQQTTVQAVIPYFEAFVQRWPTVEALAAAPDGDVMTAWAGLGYYARARNLLACARIVAREHGGRFPADEAALRTLPGIGAYTAAAIAAIAFGRRAVVVDGNVERVVARLFDVETPLPAAKPRLHALADEITPAARAGDFAQALMDLGATVCRPARPLCVECPLAAACAARRTGQPERLPARLAKANRPVRHGKAYWLEQDGKVLLVRRPAPGLLGGMLALPASDFTELQPPAGTFPGAPVNADWSAPVTQVRHVFTHFELRLDVHRARLHEPVDLPGTWRTFDRLAEGLPTLFRKAVKGILAANQQESSGT